jgi:O-antigen ligase
MSPFIVLVFLGYLLPRLINTFFALEIYGGGYTRIELIRESLRTISQHPFFGVGLGMDIFYSYQQSLGRAPGVFSYFPEAVHNGYLRLLSQVGIISFLIFLWVCFLFIKKLAAAIKKEKRLMVKIILLSVFFGLVAPLVNGFFQAALLDLKEVSFLVIIFATGANLESLI